MVWTTRDEILFSILNRFGKEHFEKQIERNTHAFLRLKHDPEWFVVFGIYDRDNHAFEWKNDVNAITYNQVIDHYMSIFGTDVTIKKLCKSRVVLESKYQNVIPYLVEFLNTRFKVVRQVHANKIIYALVTLDKDTEFNIDEFDAAMFYYRQYKKLKKTRKMRARNDRLYLSDDNK